MEGWRCCGRLRRELAECTAERRANSLKKLFRKLVLTSESRVWSKSMRTVEAGSRHCTTTNTEQKSMEEYSVCFICTEHCKV